MEKISTKKEEALRICNLTKIYQMDELKVKAVDNISFSIPKNKVIAIMGPSGSGKSTVLHLIGCLDKPTSGKIYLDGVDISHLDDDKLAKLRNQKIGFIFQFFNLYPLLNALENVELPLIISGVPEKERTKRALEILEIVGIKERAYHFPNQLSGGEQQRVAIARALINNPTIIFADEPTGNLDSKSGHKIMELLIGLKKKATVVIITHDEDIAHHADKIIRIKDGKIV